MRKLPEVLRLSDECGRSQREIASSLSLAIGTICGCLKRARGVGLELEGCAGDDGLTDSD